MSPGAVNRAEVEQMIAELDASIRERERLGQRPPQSPMEGEGAPATSVLPTQRQVEVSTPARETEPPARPWYKRWYVWTGVGAVVVGGVVAGVVAASGSKGSGLPSASLPEQKFFGAR